ncbi:nickel pincer cofactor biosynthesis protein LarC [Halorubrum sp. JWXQ-INN 858]|uniref:nickel pincer cofactor biosynthesis protein LarC n=1 Tax=Halorubrum sp. JWXQ-INN 858 TaxID=2690782 RepID=UPI00135A74D3|nr:nickel pincer cofactor biosynthesis protein LarC [Halorubrum sp. JWXQ-INN 858]MWV64176.1 nickel pincer cofactor biosynthesis protein LarC [Halorubrum sp. JWXQ-INN 858]
MRTLAFDGRTGAAGDMICAALIAAGGDPDVLTVVEDHLPVRYEVGEATKNEIRATTVDVLLAEADDGNREEDDTDDHDHSHSHDHSHDHSHSHDHDHDHGHSHDHSHAEGAGVHRTYPEVVRLVESMPLPASVESVALDAFELLGRAEASTHGTDLAETAFHEVGADDAIADVVGAALLLDDLGVERVVTTPVAAGGGQVDMSHGVYPIPAPAVVGIVERSDFAIVGGPIDRELLTPTGAAILGAVAEGVGALPSLTVTASGYGAGDATFDRHPNVLRTLVGDGGTARDAPGARTQAGAEGRLVHDDVAVLETNLDDVAPEVLGGLQDALKPVGAHDVTIVPTTMKKSRPGHLVTVICDPSDAEAVAERLARETGTLGVRQAGATHRWIAERSFETATIDIGGDRYEVSVKLGATADGDVYDVSAEYDDAAEVAAETGVPVREVMRRAEAAITE